MWFGRIRNGYSLLPSTSTSTSSESNEKVNYPIHISIFLTISKFYKQYIYPIFSSTFRRVRSRPFSFLFLLILGFCVWGWFKLRSEIKGGMGRWYWNYAISFHPIMIYLTPNPYGWGPPENGPRQIKGLNEAKWMGEWDIPNLSKPTYFKKSKELYTFKKNIPEINKFWDGDKEGNAKYDKELINKIHDVEVWGRRRDFYEDEDEDVLHAFSKRKNYTTSTEKKDPKRGDHDDYFDEKVDISTFHHPDYTINNRRLSNPVIAKLHVYSDALRESSFEKRKMIRKYSPLLSLPVQFRHLIEVKFVIGTNIIREEGHKDFGEINKEFEEMLDEEQRMYGDLFRIPNLKNGENLRDGKILDWIHAVGNGLDGGRESWFLFKVDDDTLLNVPNVMDMLISLNPHQPIYLGHSLNRWPSYHSHFTGMFTGFNWGIVKTLAQGIATMSKQDRQFAWDDDVLTGEIVMTLPSAPHCQPTLNHPLSSLPSYCDVNTPPPWGWVPPHPSPDPRTDVIWYDFLRRTGDPDLWFMKCDLGKHSWCLKFPDCWERTWKEDNGGRIWNVPNWMKKYGDPALM